MTTVPNSKITVGVDLGDRFCQLAVLDSDGELAEETRVPTTAKAIHKWFERIDASRIALEVGTHSPWISRLLQDLGHEVIVANPRKVRMIYASTNKSDRFDAQALARLARLDPALLSGIQHRGEQAQQDLAVIQAREILVCTRTRLINHIRGAVKSVGERIPRCSAASFHRKVPGRLPTGLKGALMPLVEHLESVTGEIRRYDNRIKALTTEHYPETERLRQVPGVGPITSLTFILTLEDPSRFKKSRAVGPYLGLCPRRNQSGLRDPQCRITKAGNTLLRRLLVQAAQYQLGPFGPDTDLRRWGLTRADRGGKAARKKAVIGVARKLAILLHHLWQTGETYEPLHRSESHEEVSAEAT